MYLSDQYVLLMKNVLLNLTLVLMLIPVLSQAQIENEIRNYTDSTEFYLENGRQLLMRSLADDDIQKTLEIQGFLEDITRSTLVSAFSYGEELCLAILTNRWEEAEAIVAAYEDIRKPDFYSDYHIINFLYKKVKDDSSVLLAQCDNSDIDSEAKAILKLLIYYVRENKTNDEYYNRLNSIYEKYSPLKYKAFLENFLPRREQYMSMGIALGGGMTFPNGDFGNHYKDDGSFYCSWDGKIRHAYFSLTLRTGSLKLLEPFEIESPFEYEFIEGYRFSFINVGVRSGYLMIRNKYFHLAPYVDLSYTCLKSKEFYDTSEGREYKDVNAFTFGPGIHAEIKLFEFSDDSYNNDYPEVHAVGLKIEGGYNFNLGFGRSEVKGNMTYFDAGLVWRIGGM